MINQLIKKYNALEGETEQRSKLVEIAGIAFDEYDSNVGKASKIAHEIYVKLNKILDEYDSEEFFIETLKKYSLQKTTPVKVSKQGKKKKNLPGKTRSKKNNESGLKGASEIDKRKYPLSIIKKDVPIGTRVKMKSSYVINKDHKFGYVVKHDFTPIIKNVEYPFHTQLEYPDGTKEWVKPWSFTIYTSLEEQKHLKSVLKQAGLNAPHHKGAAKNALSECGRLKKGFRYEKGGKIVKVKKQSKKKKPTQVKTRTKTSIPKPPKPEKKSVKPKPNQEPVKVDTNGQTALFGAAKQPIINFEVVESTNMVLEPVEESTLPFTPVLNAPVLEVPLKVPGREIKKMVKQSTTNNPLVINLTNTKVSAKDIQQYNITGDISAFLGDLEIKPKDSLAITIDAEQGAGKTRFVFQLLNEFASSGYKCLFVSLEEHPESKLFNDKVAEYINPANEHLIDTVGELPNWYKDLAELIPHYDCIFIDSWSKIAEEDRTVDFDKHLRKGFDSKLFVTIFQRTTSGTMRGGTKSAFDGDVILKMEKAPDFRNSFVYANKNRYQNKPLDTLKYNIYTKSLMRDNEPTVANNNQQQPTLMNFEVVG